MDEPGALSRVLVAMSRFKGSGRRFMCMGRYWQGERETDPEIG